MDRDKISKLTERDILDIQMHLERALEYGHGSGDHWILMAILDRYGFRTNSPDKAMRVAEDIIVTWYKIQ